MIKIGKFQTNKLLVYFNLLKLVDGPTQPETSLELGDCQI